FSSVRVVWPARYTVRPPCATTAGEKARAFCMSVFPRYSAAFAQPAATMPTAVKTITRFLMKCAPMRLDHPLRSMQSLQHAHKARMGREPMPESIMYHDGNRRLQDEFDSRRISDRLEEKLTRTAFTADDRTFIESAIYFFMSTADAHGHPDCSFKGGPAGFVRVTGPSEL